MFACLSGFLTNSTSSSNERTNSLLAVLLTRSTEYTKLSFLMQSKNASSPPI